MKYKKDYYQILSVKPNATPEEIKQAYRRLAILSHPDKNPTHEAVVQMQEVNEAYSVLGHERKRTDYDLERGNSSVSVQTSSMPKSNNINTAESLEQFSSEKTDAGFVFMAVAICTFILFAFGISSSSYFGTMLAGISLVSSIPVTFGILFWRSFKSRQKEAQCPRCGKSQAAESIGENFVGIFKKWAHSKNYNQDYSLTYQKYKIHYKCKYCSYEWLYIKTKRL